VTDFIIQILCSFIQLWSVPPVKETSCKCFRRADRKMNAKTMKKGSETYEEEQKKKEKMVLACEANICTNVTLKKEK